MRDCRLITTCKAMKLDDIPEGEDTDGEGRGQSASPFPLEVKQKILKKKGQYKETRKSMKLQK